MLSGGSYQMMRRRGQRAGIPDIHPHQPSGQGRATPAARTDARSCWLLNPAWAASSVQCPCRAKRSVWSLPGRVLSTALFTTFTRSARRQFAAEEFLVPRDLRPCLRVNHALPAAVASPLSARVVQSRRRVVRSVLLVAGVRIRWPVGPVLPCCSPARPRHHVWLNDDLTARRGGGPRTGDSAGA